MHGLILRSFLFFKNIIELACSNPHNFVLGCLKSQAAAAMCVEIGSFSDPFEAQGLAHFLGSFISLAGTLHWNFSKLFYRQRLKFI